MEKAKVKLTQKYLKEALHYDPVTGIFTWNERPIWHFEASERYTKEDICRRWNKRWSNKIAGCNHSLGHYYIVVNYKMHKAHRLAWLYMEGYEPEYQIDHINRIGNDNRWCNLRHVTQTCNMQNCGVRSDNASGVPGVYLHKASKKWMARINTGDKSVYLGLYEYLDDAIMARYQEEVNNPNWNCSVNSPAYQYLKENNLI